MNKTSIIGEDPTKYWEKDPVICKLEIINLDLIIKTKDIQYGNFEQEKCKNHIKALLDLKVIESNTSPHISKKILGFLDKMEDIKIIRAFLGLLNYARNFIDIKLV